MDAYGNVSLPNGWCEPAGAELGFVGSVEHRREDSHEWRWVSIDGHIHRHRYVHTTRTPTFTYTHSRGLDVRTGCTEVLKASLASMPQIAMPRTPQSTAMTVLCVLGWMGDGSLSDIGKRCEPSTAVQVHTESPHRGNGVPWGAEVV
jgi:hypothetical protein